MLLQARGGHSLLVSMDFVNLSILMAFFLILDSNMETLPYDILWEAFREPFAFYKIHERL